MKKHARHKETANRKKLSVQSHSKNQQLSQAVNKCNGGVHKTKNIYA